MFHASELKWHIANDPVLFLHIELAQPSPIVTDKEGLEEYFIEEIIDSNCCGVGWQYLDHWSSYRPEHDRWLPGSSLEDCEALDRWLAKEPAVAFSHWVF
jgi:hypothetical protein